MEKFIAEKVTQSITRIKMPYVCAYLVEGQQQAMLIDNGWGYGDIRSFVDGLTDLPYEVILTHGHCDHGGANSQFDRIYMNELDLEVEKYSCSVNVRHKILSNVLKKYDMNITTDELLPYRETTFLPLEDGSIFDLGELTLKMVHVPGHTRGSMAVIIPEERMAIFGDACTNGTLITQKSSASIQCHLEGLENLKRFEAEFDRVLTNHVTFEEPKEVLESNIMWAKRILAGEDDKVEVKRPNNTYYIARDRGKLHNAFELKGNIKYTLSRL